MPSRGSKYTKEITRLRAQGLSDGQIAERLSIGKSIIHRNLYQARTQQRLAKLLSQAGLYALKQCLVSCEVGWRWIEGERLKLLEGTSALSAENVGTLMRMQEKSLAMARAFLGKNFSASGLASAEKDSPSLRRAEEWLKTIEAREAPTE